MRVSGPSREQDNATADQTAYKEVVGLFRSPEDLERAISDITSSGWDRAALSILAQRSILQPEHLEGRTTDLADDPESVRLPAFSETDVRQGRTMLAGMAGLVAAFVASGATIMTGGGTLAAVVGAAVAGGGAGVLVEAVGHRVGWTREEFLREQVEQGGILLWVMVVTPEGESKARKILENCNASEIHVHNSDPV